MRSANLVIYLFDVHEMNAVELTSVVDEFEKEQIQYLLVGNKTDAQTEMITQKFNSFQGIVFISAKENQQIDELKKALVAKTIQGDLQTESTIITNARHFDALQKLAESLQDVQGGLDENISSDLLALDIRQCLHYLGSITGQITNEDQLDFIFSKFCIGK